MVGSIFYFATTTCLRHFVISSLYNCFIPDMVGFVLMYDSVLIETKTTNCYDWQIEASKARFDRFDSKHKKINVF